MKAGGAGDSLMRLVSTMQSRSQTILQNGLQFLGFFTRAVFPTDSWCVFMPVLALEFEPKIVIV
jgi:hypothetical protein